MWFNLCVFLKLWTCYTAGIQRIHNIIHYTVSMVFFRIWTTQEKKSLKSQKRKVEMKYTRWGGKQFGWRCEK